MAALSNYLENKIVDHILRGIAYTAPATVYVGLLTAAPNDAGGGTEVSGGSYARVAVAVSDTAWNNTQGTASGASTGTDGTIENASTITFSAPTAAWGVVTHFAVYDASSGGNLLFQAALQAAKTINNGDAAPSFAAGVLSLQIDN